MSRMMFVNLPVADLGKSIEFFSQLGFEFNPQFTDETATCMIVGESNFVMLLTREKFSGFAPGLKICDTGKSTEVLVCLSADSRAEVDAMLSKAVAAGGSNFREPEDYGFMYGRSFRDLDGHIWEIMWMDPAAVQQPS
ncbi:VOC family protein [Microbulbifer harenosus]|uniref:Glyoxalase/bleomycin resistance/extradiol dioxygenase family protein n=1 Tax=Microbulbifer harenosus TaxID=2576840 RepID=A0ABY2ULW2_9GAMM|nr:VOC family protein [Microbulbifer harenosus]TLM79359.1 glyoxalase/bleomycin resistance/extradiol dioxygenase family protein [Microbulbifer harenosus]